MGKIQPPVFIARLREEFFLLIPKGMIDLYELKSGYYVYSFENGALELSFLCSLQDKETYEKSRKIKKLVKTNKRFYISMPTELRDYFNAGCNLRLYYLDGKIHIKEQPCFCAICYRSEELNDFMDKKLCRSCISSIIDTFIH